MIKDNSVLAAIKSRRSIRKFRKQPISPGHINTILDAGHWAPSGLNNQPWRFSIINNYSIKLKISECTKYTQAVSSADTLIAVFYHIPSGYNREKDIMSIGACIQNMLLTAHSLGIGSVWLGEILKNKVKINSILKINSDHELMAIVALGFSDEAPQKSRKNLGSLTLKNSSDQAIKH